MTDHSPDHAERAREAEQLLTLLVAYDDEAAPNGIMDAVDNDRQPYQSAAMAGLIVHARAWLEPDALNKRLEQYRSKREAAGLSSSSTAALCGRDAEEACPLCEGKPMPSGMGCVAGCRDGVVLTTSANVLRNVKPLLERSADATVEWEVWQDDMPVATSTGEGDAMHYLMVYGQDGPATLMRVERTEIARAAIHDDTVRGEG